jgi:hypothetical protein
VLKGLHKSIEEHVVSEIAPRHVKDPQVLGLGDDHFKALTHRLIIIGILQQVECLKPWVMRDTFQYLSMIILVLKARLNETKHVKLLLLLHKIRKVGASLTSKDGIFKLQGHHSAGLSYGIEKILHGLVIQLFDLHQYSCNIFYFIRYGKVIPKFFLIHKDHY